MRGTQQQDPNVERLGKRSECDFAKNHVNILDKGVSFQRGAFLLEDKSRRLDARARTASSKPERKISMGEVEGQYLKVVHTQTPAGRNRIISVSQLSNVETQKHKAAAKAKGLQGKPYNAAQKRELKSVNGYEARILAAYAPEQKKMKQQQRDAAASLKNAHAYAKMAPKDKQNAQNRARSEIKAEWRDKLRKQRPRVQGIMNEYQGKSAKYSLKGK